MDTNLGNFTQYWNFNIYSLIFTGSENVTNGTYNNCCQYLAIA
jgi:hypothetical protein